MKRRAALFAIGCITTLGLSAAVKPTRKASELYFPVKLAEQIPKQFAGWQIDPSIVPVLPNPAAQAALDQIYSQTLACTYVNPRGHRVMLSIAYGADQASDATQAHRPEFCYAGHGFRISRIGQSPLVVGSKAIDTARLVGTLGTRAEYITYWMTLNDKAVLPGISRQWAQMRLGLSGVIPDGMLVRSSTIGLSQAESFDVQGEFLSHLYASLPSEARARYFGS